MRTGGRLAHTVRDAHARGADINEGDRMNRQDVTRALAGITAAGMVSALSVGVAGAQAPPRAANAVIRGAGGPLVGTASLTEAAEGARIALLVRVLPAGGQGLHIHATGTCEGPAFTSAGGHFNPTGAQHGLRNPAGAHAGDLPELVVAANGTASYATTTNRLTLGAGLLSLFDADGSSIVIHADPDDHVTDPTGNSGARIACGQIVAGAATLPATGAATPLPVLALTAAALALTTGLGFARLARRSRRLS